MDLEEEGERSHTSHTEKERFPITNPQTNTHTHPTTDDQSQSLIFDSNTHSPTHTHTSSLKEPHNKHRHTRKIRRRTCSHFFTNSSLKKTNRHTLFRQKISLSVFHDSTLTTGGPPRIPPPHTFPPRPDFIVSQVPRVTICIESIRE